MRHPRIFDQTPGEIVDVSRWELDVDFPYLPGEKPKRTLKCPAPAPFRFLIGDHRYLYKHPFGRSEKQIWSEVIAYKISRVVSMDVPPAFIAYDSRAGTSGVLMEYFYREHDTRELRFFHARDVFQALRMPLNEKRGALISNLALCRTQRVPRWREWWAETIAFDTLIGNTDRHSQNWGFLVEHLPAPNTEMAPAFDNGSSLGWQIREEDLGKYSKPDLLSEFIRKGLHHYDWRDPKDVEGGHVMLCRKMIERYSATLRELGTIASISDAEIDRILGECTAFDLPIRFSCERADFARAQLLARRKALTECVGG